MDMRTITTDCMDTAPQGLPAVQALAVAAAFHGRKFSAERIAHKNMLSVTEVSFDDLERCAESIGLRSKATRLDWLAFSQLGQAFPAVVGLKDGGCLVAVSAQPEGVVVRDPAAQDDAVLIIPRETFEAVWTTQALLLRPAISTPTDREPFSLATIHRLIFQESRIVRNLLLCAFIASVLSLAPIVLYQVLFPIIASGAATTLFTVTALALASFGFDAAFFYLRGYLLTALSARIDTRLSDMMFEGALQLPMSYYESSTVGRISRDMSEIYKIRMFLTGQLFGTTLDSFILVVFLPVMLLISPIMTLVVLAMALLIIVWIFTFLPTYREHADRTIDAEGERISFLVQSLLGVRTAKSLAIEERLRAKWDGLVARAAKQREADGRIAATLQSGIRPLERLAVTGSFAVGVYLAVATRSQIEVGALFAFMIMSQKIVGPLIQLAQLVYQLDEFRAAVAIVSALLNQPKESGSTHSAILAPISGRIKITDLTFSYPGRTAPAIDDLSLDISSGMILGVVGRSGSGKTTLTRLLQRLHTDYLGQLKIDGIDVREYDIAHLRKNIGVVLQDSFLFSGTIHDNIISAKPDATFDEVVRAARMSGAEEFIDRMPGGYNTFIYEGSPNLSGGQRQRIAIARALILDPPILILDEATSALDPDSESIVNENIKRFARGRTTIVISHRLSSLVHSDAILVLEQGAFVDIGAHQQLLKRCDIYRELWRQQNRHLTKTATAARMGAR